MSAGDTLTFNVNWFDPNYEAVSLELDVEISTNTYFSTQLSWISIDNSGLVTISPESSNDGEKTLTFYVFDGCYTAAQSISFTIQ